MTNNSIPYWSDQGITWKEDWESSTSSTASSSSASTEGGPYPEPAGQRAWPVPLKLTPIDANETEHLTLGDANTNVGPATTESMSSSQEEVSTINANSCDEEPNRDEVAIAMRKQILSLELSYIKHRARSSTAMRCIVKRLSDHEFVDDFIKGIYFFEPPTYHRQEDGKILPPLELCEFAEFYHSNELGIVYHNDGYFEQCCVNVSSLQDPPLLIRRRISTDFATLKDSVVVPIDEEILSYFFQLFLDRHIKIVQRIKLLNICRTQRYNDVVVG